jgi:hypothetical protein
MKFNCQHHASAVLPQGKKLSCFKIDQDIVNNKTDQVSSRN